jgi:hypothetical protein
LRIRSTSSITAWPDRGWSATRCIPRSGTRPLPTSRKPLGLNSAVSRLDAGSSRITSLEKNSIPQLVWWMTKNSRVSRIFQLMTRDRIASSLARPSGITDHVRVAFSKVGVLAMKHSNPIAIPNQRATILTISTSDLQEQNSPSRLRTVRATRKRGTRRRRLAASGVGRLNRT